MSDIADARIELAPSRLRRRWLIAAAAACLALALALAAAAWQSAGSAFVGSALTAAAAACSAATACAALRAAARAARRPRPRLRIGHDGSLAVYEGAHDGGDPPDGDLVKLRPLSVLPALVVLRAPGREVVVWRDAVPAAAFRRIAALARWSA